MNVSDFNAYAFFTTNGRDVWKMLYSCTSPTCRLRNLETGEEQDFGMGGLTAESFHKITMPVDFERGATEAIAQAEKIAEDTITLKKGKTR